MTAPQAEGSRPDSSRTGAPDSLVLLGGRIGIGLSALIMVAGVALGFRFGFSHTLYHDKGLPVTANKIFIFGFVVTALQFAFLLWARKRSPRSTAA